MVKDLRPTAVKIRKTQEVHRKKFRKNTNEHDKEILKERYITPEGRQKIINDLTFNIIV